MNITLTKEQWRELYESTLRKKKQAERLLKDCKAYIDDSERSQSKRWTEDFEYRHWHYMRLETAESAFKLQVGILKALEEASNE